MSAVMLERLGVEIAVPLVALGEVVRNSCVSTAIVNTHEPAKPP